jgi:hypothetical protein
MSRVSRGEFPHRREIAAMADDVAIMTMGNDSPEVSMGMVSAVRNTCVADGLVGVPQRLTIGTKGRHESE